MIWGALVAVLLLTAGASDAATRYAGPTPTGSSPCTNSASPCSVRDAMLVAACGDTVILLDGTYQGATQMLDMEFNIPEKRDFACTSGNELTIQAETDGGVFIDAQFASSRVPLGMWGNEYWNVSGFDVGNGAVYVSSIFQSVNSNFRRICSSNTANVAGNNQIVWWVFDTQNTLMEDICAFGRGRNIVQEFCSGQISTGNTFRRFWLRFEGIDDSSGSNVIQTEYYEFCPAGSGNNIYENIISVFSGEQFATSPTGAGFNRRWPSTEVRRRGWVMYGYDSAPAASDFWYREQPNLPSAISNLVDIFVDGRSQTIQTFSYGCTGSSDCSQNSADRITAIRNSSASAASMAFSSQTNINECTSLGACPNFYTGDSPGTGSRACFRYENGTLTSTPLWPWPMDDRIKAALARANAAGTGGTALSGSAGTGYAAATVTSEIVSRYGSIPSACLSAGSFTPSFPVASDFPSVDVIDNFDRANSASLGANWTRMFGSDDFSIVSNQAAAGATYDRTLYTGSQITASHEVYATFSTIQTAGSGYLSVLSFAAEAAADNPQYRVRINRQSGANTLIKVEKIDSGGSVAATPIPETDLGTDIADGNAFGVRVSGTTLSLYWKWTDGIWYRVDQVTDATLPTGMVYGGIGGQSPMVLDDFGAGPTSGTPEPPNPPGSSSGAGRFGTTFPGVR